MTMNKRIMSLLLTFTLCLSMLPVSPVTVYAAEGTTIGTSGLCDHHTEHTEDCGYVEGTEEIPCAHEHGEDCYAEITSCIHSHTEDCYPVMDSGVSGNEATPSDAAEPICGHVCSGESGCVTEGLNCTHTAHDDTCGYTAAVEGHYCHYECGSCAKQEQAATPTDAAEAACTCEAAEGEPHTENCALYEAPADSVCTCGEKCAEDAINSECAVCAADYNACNPEIAFTGITCVSEYYAYDEPTNTYTIAILTDQTKTSALVQYVGKNLEYIDINNTTLGFKTNDSSSGERIWTLTEGFVSDFQRGYWDVPDGYWMEFFYSNDSGNTWVQGIRLEVKQAYSIGNSTAADANGTVTVKEYAIAGETVVLDVSPADGYMLDTLTVTDANGNPVTVENNAFTMPAGAVSVTATFNLCDHSGGTAPCKDKAICSVCNTAYGSTADHTWSTEGVCTVCSDQAVAQLTSNSDNIVSYYTDLQSALDVGAGMSSSYRIKLLDDVTGSFTAAGPIGNIDLNGKTITAGSADTPALKITDKEDTVHPSISGGTIQSDGGTALEITGETSGSHNQQFSFGVNGDPLFGPEDAPLHLSGKTAIKASSIALNLEIGSISATENAVVLSDGATVDFSVRTSVALNGTEADFAIEGTYADAPLSFDTINMPGTVYTITMENPGVFAKPGDFASLYDFQLETSMFTSAMEGYVVVKDGDNLKLAAKGITEGMVRNTPNGEYNGSAHTVTADQFTVVWTDTSGNETTLAAGSDYEIQMPAEEMVNAGDYTITIVGKGDYTGEVAATYTIAKADPVFTTAPEAITGLVYTGFEMELIFSGISNDGEIQYSLDGTTYTSTVPTGTVVDTYTVYYKIIGDSNHNDKTFDPITVSIGKGVAPTITEPTAKPITYGDKLSASELSESGWAWVDGTIVPNAATSYNAYIEVDDSNYDYTSVYGYDSANHRVVRDITVIINKATLTITANSYTIKVGDTLPTYAYDVTGLVNGDTLPFNVSLSCSATDSNTVGTYPITISGVVSDALASLYAPIYVNGTLTISEKDIQEIEADDVTLTYGETGKKITATTSGDGTISYSTTSDIISVAADGTITALKAGTATVTVKAAETDNYAEATKTVTVTVNKAAVTVTAKSYTIKVGDTLPTYAYDVAGLVNGETLPIDVTISCNAADSNTAGTYTITVSGAANSTNYTFAYANGTLTISNKLEQTITASDVTLTYGETGKKITATTNGNGAISYSTTSDVISVAADGTITALKAGTATVTINVAETDTYAAATKTVTVTVNKAAVTVTAKSYTIKVGEALPTYAYDVAGLVNGETLPIDVTISCNAADSNTAGTYDIIVSGAAASDNYTFSYVKGTLTVSEKEVVAAPTFTPASGTTFTSSQKVTISCATAGAKIYYTTDGTEPTTASTLYNGAFTITTTTTVKAIAVKDGMTDSSVVTATYTKKSSGGGGGYGGGGYRPTTPTNPEINDKSASWTTIADDISKLSIGSEVTIELNGNYDVPVEVIKAIAEKDAKVTFIVNSTRSWYLDGKEIDAPSAADLSILAIASLNADALRGEVGAKFRIDGTNIPTELTVAVDKKHAGKFANLYMKKENELVFVDNVKVNENGEVILPVSEKGDYVIMLCEYSDRKGDVSNDGITNALDASAILKDIVELEAAPNPAMRDYNGDGKINALDASDILKDIVNDRI